MPEGIIPPRKGDKIPRRAFKIVDTKSGNVVGTNFKVALYKIPPAISKDVEIVLNSMNEDLQAFTRQIMVGQGVEDSSDLVKSVSYRYKNNMFSLMANDYYQAVSKGRKPRAKKVPIEDLLDWMKKKNIGGANKNSVAYAIQQAIYRHGITGKNFEEAVIDANTKIIEEQMADTVQMLTMNGTVVVMVSHKRKSSTQPWIEFHRAVVKGVTPQQFALFFNGKLGIEMGG